jgi:hypothetical protein
VNIIAVLVVRVVATEIRQQTRGVALLASLGTAANKLAKYFSGKTSGQRLQMQA